MSGGAEDARWRQLTLGLFGQPPPSFDSFFPGANGEAVRAVQHWAAGGPGPWCVLLWGAHGVGKSHLLQSALRAADAAGAPNDNPLVAGTAAGAAPLISASV